MSDGQGQGKKPTDDRTLLDPLSSDELKALREARQRMQAKKDGGAAVAHQIVIGPDGGEDIGDAPTRAMPALPTFEGNVSLDQIGTNPPGPADPANRAVGGPPSEPMSVHGQHPASVPPTPQVQPGPSSGANPVPGGPGAPGGPPQPGQPGFGENTLLWMQPPKPPPGVAVGGAATPDVLPKTSAKEQAKFRIKTILAAVVLLGILGVLIYSVAIPKARGVLELHTNPPKAEVRINGKKSNEKTPVKLTLPAGEHSIEVRLEGHDPESFVVTIEGEDSQERRDVELMPISKPGLVTVSVHVQPVSANIVFDDVTHSGRSFKKANVDPKKPHRITVEAGGYVKISQDIGPNELKPEYNFALQKDDTVPQ